MALSRSVQHSATCVAILLGLALGGLQAAEGQAAKPYEYQDLRFGWTSAPTPNVYLKSKSGGGSTRYEGGESRGSRYTVTYLCGRASEENKVGTVFGGQFSLGSYSIGDNGVETSLIQPMVDVYYGWQYGIVDTPALRGWIEMMPFVGVGGSLVEIDSKQRLGYAVETGVRVGVYLTERSWQFGVTTSGLLGTSKAKGDVNELTMDTHGFTFGGEIGYRF